MDDNPVIRTLPIQFDDNRAIFRICARLFA